MNFHDRIGEQGNLDCRGAIDCALFSPHEALGTDGAQSIAPCSHHTKRWGQMGRNQLRPYEFPCSVVKVHQD